MAEQKRTRVLILGATGMLGSTLFRAFSNDPALDTFGTMRDASGALHFSPSLRSSLITNVDVEDESDLLKAFDLVRPEVAINCVGIIKQLPNANDYLESLAINSSLPHRLVRYCSVVGARLLHFSTDCVFSGTKGGYVEGDFPDADDLYGRTKFLGELDYGNAITLRTSIIGHELASSRSLVDWFLSQPSTVKGYRKAIFSGLPTCEIARIVRNFVLPNPHLRGVYHLSGEPINKYELLRLVAMIYGKAMTIEPDDNVVIDRSLNSNRFRLATGFIPKPWPELIKAMYSENAALMVQGH